MYLTLYIRYDKKGIKNPILSRNMELIDWLYRGKDRFVTDGILCTPCKDFLMELRPDRTLDKILT
jgi:hypothetical protein